MAEEGDSGYYSTSGQFIEAPKRQLFRIQIPYSLRFGIIWTLFFIIVGIAIQSLKANAFVFQDFFVKNYVQWFADFGAFTDVTLYPDANSIIFAILSKWYYFFYTGGLIALIWGILSWIINFEMVVKKPAPRPQLPREKVKIKEVIKPIIIEREVQAPAPAPRSSSPLVQKKINEWLESGLLLLSEGQVEEAELIYEQISREYDSSQDIDHDTYKRILDFYYEISARRQQK